MLLFSCLKQFIQREHINVFFLDTFCTCVVSILIDFIKALFNLCMALLLKIYVDITPRSINLQNISSSLE